MQYEKKRILKEKVDGLFLSQGPYSPRGKAFSLFWPLEWEQTQALQRAVESSLHKVVQDNQNSFPPRTLT